MNRSGTAAALRFAAACALLLVLAQLAGRELLEALLPAYRWMVGLLDDRYRILYLGLASQGADSVVRLDVALQRPVLIGGQIVMPDPRGHAQVTTLAGSALQAVVVFLAALLAWPLRARTEAAFRALLGLPAGLLLLLADLPFVLVGELWALFVERYAPGAFSPLLAWKDFLQGGGRLALACAGGALAVGGAQALAGRWRAWLRQYDHA